jgi:XdhC Rossmann domain
MCCSEQSEHVYCRAIRREPRWKKNVKRKHRVTLGFRKNPSGDLGPVLRGVLDHPARWVGILASPRHTAPHIAALESLGVPAEQIARVHWPIGLNIGSRTSAEIAIPSLAGLLADRTGRPGGFDFWRSRRARPNDHDHVPVVHRDPAGMAIRRVICPLFSQNVLLAAMTASSGFGWTFPSTSIARDATECGPGVGVPQSSVQNLQA